MGAAILDFFTTGVFLDNLEVDAFLFGIVTIISLTDFDSRGWNAGCRLVADDCCSGGACCALLGLVMRAGDAGCVARAGWG